VPSRSWRVTENRFSGASARTTDIEFISLAHNRDGKGPEFDLVVCRHQVLSRPAAGRLIDCEGTSILCIRELDFDSVIPFVDQQQSVAGGREESLRLNSGL
jgi:hypothetical protein